MGERALRWMPTALVTVLLGWIAARAARPVNDPDAWWHLRLGNDLIDQRSLSTPDHWSAFATVHWVPTEPLPEIVAAYVDRWWGLPGLAVLYDVAGAAVVLGAYLVCRRRSAALPAAVTCVLVVLAASASLTSRPQLVSFVLLPVVIDAWLRTEEDQRTRWWLVPLVWAWSLCHGFWFLGAAYGFVFVAGFALSRRMPWPVVARQAVVAVASFAVVVLNPVGLGVIEAPFRVNDTSQFIQEWARTDLTSPSALGALVMVLGTAAVWLVRRRGVSWAHLLVLLSAAFWIWYAGRTVAVAGLVVAPLLAAALDGLLADRDEHTDPPRRSREATVLGAVALVIAAVVVAAAPAVADRPGDVPTALDPALDRLPPGTRVFNAYELGGWLAWRHPDLEQYIDGLITPYSARHAQDYVDATSTAPGWPRIVDRSGASAALLPQGSPLALGLSRRGWRSVGRDDGYVLLETPAVG